MKHKDLGRNIRIVREIRSYSQRYLSEMLGISQSYYSRIERGQVDITIGVIEQIADVLDIKLTELLTLNPSELLTKRHVSSQDGVNTYQLNMNTNKVSMVIGYYQS